jgi:hypothetical protein
LQARLPVACQGAYTAAVILGNFAAVGLPSHGVHAFVPVFSESDLVLAGVTSPGQVHGDPAAGASDRHSTTTSTTAASSTTGSSKSTSEQLRHKLRSREERESELAGCCVQMHVLGTTGHTVALPAGCGARPDLPVAALPAARCMSDLRRRVDEQQYGVLSCSSPAHVVEGLAICCKVCR